MWRAVPALTRIARSFAVRPSSLPVRRHSSRALPFALRLPSVQSPPSPLPALSLSLFTHPHRCHRCFPSFFRTHPRFYAMATACGHNHGDGAGAVAAPKYRHVRSDFGPLVTKPLHLDLEFDMTETSVRVTCRTTFLHTAEEPLRTLQLNSKELDIESVELLTGASELPSAHQSSSDAFVSHVSSLAKATATPLKYDVDTKDHFLNVHLEKAVNKGEQFVLRTVSVAKPTAHILEGLYFDWTPENQPKTIITQCQQYGFQRIVPSLDFMTSKSYYTTRIIADKRYSHLITNGDLAPGFFDPATGEPRPQPVAGDDKRVMVEYHNHKVNMASYLFFLGVGTYQAYRGEVEYCDGSTFTAELLVFPGLVEQRHAQTALQSLIDSIMWCYLSTGPEATEHEQERARIYQLIPVRDALKAEKLKAGGKLAEEKEKELADVRDELKKLIGVWGKTGYAYTGAIYREISMQNSDYGGMENVGNTTILASRMVPSDLLGDPGYLYMEGVKIHEYYHNINGSQVTGESPFEIWLNEAVTVYIQRQRENVLFGSDFMRLKEVLYSFTPGQGPLAIDAGPNAMPIEPRGYNRTQELISAMTYSKAPEFVNMVKLFIGEATFNRGLDHYHTKFSYSNATTDDWIRSMEHASGQSLMPMANLWLRRSGHPHILYHGDYDAQARTYTLHMEQTQLPSADPQAWILPVDWALVKDGAVTHTGVHRLSQVKDTLVISDVATEPDFLSFAKGWSYFGTHANTKASRAQLARQALTDPDVVNRYFAYRAVVDAEKAAIIEALRKEKQETGVKTDERAEGCAAGVTVSPELVQLHAAILFDDKITAGARASLLREGEDIHSRKDLSFLYWEISDARLALLQAVYDAHAERILQLYTELQSRNTAGPHLAQLHERALKHHLFTLLAAGNYHRSVLASRHASKSAVKADVAKLARDLLSSPFMSDKVFAFSQFLSGPASPSDKQSVLAEVRNAFSAHPDSIETYVGVIAGVDSPDAPRMIRELMGDKQMFDPAQAGHARTAVRMWAGLRKRSLLTDEGLDLTVDMFLQIGKVNQYSAQSFIAALNDLDKFDAATKGKLVAAVRRMHAGLDPVKEESLYNQLTSTLAPYKDL